MTGTRRPPKLSSIGKSASLNPQRDQLYQNRNTIIIWFLCYSTYQICQYIVDNKFTILIVNKMDGCWKIFEWKTFTVHIITIYTVWNLKSVKKNFTFTHNREFWVTFLNCHFWSCGRLSRVSSLNLVLLSWCGKTVRFR